MKKETAVNKLERLAELLEDIDVREALRDIVDHSSKTHFKTGSSIEIAALTHAAHIGLKSIIEHLSVVNHNTGRD